VDEEENVLLDEGKGKIVIVGNTVSVGYWNNEELNQKVFGKCEIDGKHIVFIEQEIRGIKRMVFYFTVGE